MPLLLEHICLAAPLPDKQLAQGGTPQRNPVPRCIEGDGRDALPRNAEGVDVAELGQLRAGLDRESCDLGMVGIAQDAELQQPPAGGRAQLPCCREFKKMLRVWLLARLRSYRGRWGQHPGMLCNAHKMLRALTWLRLCRCRATSRAMSRAASSAGWLLRVWLMFKLGSRR